VCDLTVFDVATGLDRLEPFHVLQRDVADIPGAQHTRQVSLPTRSGYSLEPVIDEEADVVTEPEDRVPTDEQVHERCEQLAELVGRHELTVATAESLTAGNLASHLGRATASGDWYCGGVVAYRKEVKHAVLHAPPGPVVSEDAARAMAKSVAELMGAHVALAVTGEAGPQCQEDVPPGTVWFGMYRRGEVWAEHHVFDGEPESVLAQTIGRSLDLLLELADNSRTSDTRSEGTR
jgi:nicotinamide-nucleotide amidase